jgi:hypothetical protein
MLTKGRATIAGNQRSSASVTLFVHSSKLSQRKPPDKRAAGLLPCILISITI